MQDKRLLRMLHRHKYIEICIYNWPRLKLAKYKYIPNLQDMLAKINILEITKM